jgi:DNA-binding MarR family transcriptional regulator
MVSVNDQDEALHLVALVERLWRQIKAELDAASREIAPELRPSHVRLLGITPDTGMRMGDLAGKAHMTAQSLGEFVDTLCRNGYAEVIPDPTDRRARLVRPTPHGREIGQTIRDTVLQLEQLYADDFSPARWQAFRDVLAALDRPTLTSDNGAPTANKT